MSRPLVSMVTPCYNSEAYVGRFIESVIAQSYPNIELILVDDGSDDATVDVIRSYEDRLRNRGILLTVVELGENRGQAAALNRGLAVFRGEYLMWPDSDDELEGGSLAIRVEYLENHRDRDLVCSALRLVDGEGRELGVRKRVPPDGADTLFRDLILGQNVVFQAYMVRRSSLLHAIRNGRIYESRGGQNWQMLLPVAQKGSCGYIADVLYTVHVRAHSHSREVVGAREMLERADVHEDLLRNVIEEIEFDEQASYLELVRVKYVRRRLAILLAAGRRQEFNAYYSSVSRGDLGIRGRVMFLRANSPAFRLFYGGSFSVAQWVWRIGRDLSSRVR